jgi:hypothetical protein
VRLGDRWTSVPAAFDVKRADTIGAVLERAGDTTYRDPATGEADTLSRYAAAGADPATKVHSATEALAPLEGRRLDVEGLPLVRSGIDALLHAPAQARRRRRPRRPRPSSRRCPGSPVAERLGDATIADMAAQPRNAFVARVVEIPKGSPRATARRHAEAVHDAAKRLARLADAWGHRSAAAGKDDTAPRDRRAGVEAILAPLSRRTRNADRSAARRSPRSAGCRR